METESKTLPTSNKESLFSSVVNLLMTCEDWQETDEFVRNHLNQNYSSEVAQLGSQCNINKLLDRILIWRQIGRADLREIYEREFRSFIHSSGIKLKDFDRVLRESAGRSFGMPMVTQFLKTYYLIIQGQAPLYMIDSAFTLVSARAYSLFVQELHNNPMESSSSEMLELYDTRLAMLESSTKTEACQALLQFYIKYSETPLKRVTALLATPYLKDDPAEWLMYLFSLYGEEAPPILRRILDAFVDLSIMETRQ